MKTLKPKKAVLRWTTPFWPDWSTGSGKGEPVAIFGGAELEMTDKGKNGKSRWRVPGTNLQSYLDEYELHKMP